MSKMKNSIIWMIGLMAISISLTGCGTKGGETEQANPTDAPQTQTEQTDSTDAPQAPTEQTEQIDSTDASQQASQKDEASLGSGEKNQQASQEGGQANQILSEKEAEQIALKDAGLATKDVTGLQIKLDTDDGRQEYEIEFHTDKMKYEYDIDTASGEIRSKDTEKKNSSSSSNSPAHISTQKAIKIALDKVPGASKKDIQIEYDADIDDDTDAAQAKYEGSIIYKGMEYEFEIDAITGKILSWEEESAHD